MEVVCPKCKEARTLSKKPREGACCIKCGLTGRPKDRQNIKKPYFWDEVPDDHKCINCNRTKHEKVSFYVVKLVSGKLSVKPQCNLCRGAGLKYPRKKPMTEPKPKKKIKSVIPIKVRINEYFKTKEY